MKRLLSFVYTLLVGSMTLWAVHINENAARQIAASFMKAAPSLHASSLPKQKLTTAYVSKRSNGENRFYVFNYPRSEGGFIIVSGDDRIPAVLGYSPDGAFDADSIPPGMHWLLQQYAAQIDALSAESETGAIDPLKVLTLPRLQLSPATISSQRETCRQKATNATNQVEPLLGNIAWNQDTPFNDLCPTLPSGSKAPSGCLATAMAQIMRYHQHPAQGTGSYEYESPNGGLLSADFGSTHYDWSNMLETYESSYNTTQANAVATLMYHCGISVNMQYSTVSNSDNIFAAKALYNYFDYDRSMSYLERKHYGDTEWEELIRTELDAGRPIIYGGTTASGGGHAFVCDGYNTNGYFHINWGWSGQYNGYFLLRALKPAGQGIGGYEGGYNNNQTMVIGIRPDQGGKKPALITSDSIRSMYESIDRRTDSLRLIGNMINKDWDVARVQLGVLIYSEAGELMKTLLFSGSISDLDSKHGFIFRETNPYKNRFPDDLADGTYHICFGFLTEDSPTWQPTHMSPYTSNAVQAVVSGHTVTFSNLPPKEEEPETPTFDLIALANQTVVPVSVSSTEDFTITTVLSNKGSALSGKLYVAILNGSIEQSLQISQSVPFEIDKEQEIPVSFTCNMEGYPSMVYYLEIIAVIETGTAVDGRYFVPMDNDRSMLVEVRENGGTTPSEPGLSIVEDQSTLLQEFIQFTDYDMSLTLYNSGTDFQGNVYALLWDGSQYVLHQQAIPVNVPQGKTVKADYTWNVPTTVVPGKYVFSFAQIEDDLYRFIPIDEQGSTGIYVNVIANDKAPVLNLVSNRTSAPRIIYQNTDFTMSSALQNNGTTTFTGKLSLMVMHSDGTSAYNTYPFLPVTVEAGETIPLEFTGNVKNLDEGTYYIGIATVTDGNAALINYDTGGNVTSVKVQTQTDLPDTESKAIRVYPNPANDYLVVHCGESLNRIQLLAPTGRVWIDEMVSTGNEKRIDIKEIPAGVYLLSAETEHGVHITKVIKR